LSSSSPSLPSQSSISSSNTSGGSSLPSQSSSNTLSGSSLPSQSSTSNISSGILKPAGDYVKIPEALNISKDEFNGFKVLFIKFSYNICL